MAVMEPAGYAVGSEHRLIHLGGVFQMTVSIANLQPVVALIAGVLILVMPRLLNYIVAIYLIVVGILGLGILR
jgi:hypothetical protein